MALTLRDLPQEWMSESLEQTKERIRMELCVLGEVSVELADWDRRLAFVTFAAAEAAAACVAKYKGDEPSTPDVEFTFPEEPATVVVPENHQVLRTPNGGSCEYI